MGPTLIAEGTAFWTPRSRARHPARTRSRPRSRRCTRPHRHSSRPTGRRSLRSMANWPGGAPSPVVEVNRAVAVGLADGPLAGLAVLAPVLKSGELDGYGPLHAAHADLLDGQVSDRPPLRPGRARSSTRITARSAINSRAGPRHTPEETSPLVLGRWCRSERGLAVGEVSSGSPQAPAGAAARSRRWRHHAAHPIPRPCQRPASSAAGHWP